MSSASNTTSTSLNFETIFNAALTEYTKRTGKDLRNHPLASKIDSCDNPESILDIFQEQAQAFDKFREGDTKLFKWLRPVVDVLHAIFTNGTFKDKASHVFPPAKAVFSAIGFLLSTAKDVSESYDALVNIFECIENFLRRLSIYNEILPTPAITEMVIKIMAELINVLALATKQIEQGRFKKYANKILGEKDIESVLDRLNRLTLEESKITAAQTLDVVCRLVNKMQVVMEDGKASTGDIRQTLVLMQELVTEARKAKRDRFQEKVRGWLSAPDPWVNQNIARKAHHDGTATWFTQGDVFHKWKSEGSIMWIHGLPGSGKSVLCSSIVEDVKAMCQTGLATLAFFYFDFRDIGKQDARSLLSSLLIQMCHESDKFSEILSSRYSTHGNGTQQPSENVLLECLKDMLKARGQGELYIIVDALDECPCVSGYPTPREQVLKILQELVDLRPPHVHFCFTSRPEVDIRDALEGLAVHNVSLHDQAGQNRDILDYIESVVSSDPKIQRWREEDRQLVMTTLVKRARGMFRWVYCQIETLRRCFPTSIRRALDELPETLDGTYEQSLRRIDKQKWDFACRLFQCLVVSKRPLRVEELAEFFAIQPNVDTIPTFDAHCRPENPEEFILSACSTLVVVVNNPGHKIVQFSHFSVREYLTSDRIAISEHISRFHILPRPAHALLASACLSVLLQLDDRIIQDEIQAFPLASYAAQYWVDHAQFEDVASEIQHGMEGLFDKDKPHFAAWYRLYDIDYQSPYPGPPHPAPLYYAALCGFRHLAEHLIDAHPQHVNVRGGCRVTPLHAALDKGHSSVAILLLERGADIETRDPLSRTSLHIASYHGYADVVSLLILRGADPNTETNNGETPLYLAFKNRRQDATRSLLEHGADANHQYPNGLTPLRAAWREGHIDIVRLLLDYGADAKSPDNRGRSPLHIVLQEGHHSDILLRDPLVPYSLKGNPAFLEHRLNIVLLLFEHGADANFSDNNGDTPLHIALRGGLIDISRLLLNHGADANYANNHSRTPLHIASQGGFIDIVRLLLHHGADTNFPDSNGSTPLQLASSEGHHDMVRLLLAHSAVVNPSANDGWTPLHLALGKGDVHVVRLLLDHGADANSPDSNGRTPLQLASSEGHYDMVRLLLAHGAVVNPSTNDRLTPLHLALRKGDVHGIQLLLDHGADANPSNRDSWAPLHLALQKGDTHVVRLLLNHGADANYPDNSGRTPLHLASRDGRDDIVQLLLDHGADTKYPDSDGWISLHLAAQDGHEHIVRLLLDHGADANYSDSDGLTPLHVASREGHNYIVQLLLDHGADASRSDNDGWSPLHAASQESHYTVVCQLLEHGAATDHPDRDGWTPLHAASQEGHDDIVRLLLKHGAAPNHQDNRGRTPLHLAWKKSNSHHTSSYLLLRPDAGANCPGSDGWTLLRLVAKRGNNNIVRLLLKHGADANQPDSDGLTPLHLAQRLGTAATSTSYYSVTAQR